MLVVKLLSYIESNQELWLAGGGSRKWSVVLEVVKKKRRKKEKL